MRLAISNIAWDVTEDSAVAHLLRQFRIDAIDIAPGKYFPKPASANRAEIAKVKEWWSKEGIEITGMQALLFGTVGLNIFGGSDSQAAMLAHLTEVCRIGGVLGARRLVFGSPRNRDCTGLNDDEAKEIAIEFFRSLGDIAESNGVIVCLEPNPTCYGANFMTTSAQTVQIVELIEHPAIRMQIDTGAMTINQECPATVISESLDLIGHIHASEPNLVTLGEGGTDHDAAFEALHAHAPDALVSIEMLATERESHLVAIERALKVAIGSYRRPLEIDSLG